MAQSVCVLQRIQAEWFLKPPQGCPLYASLPCCDPTGPDVPVALALPSWVWPPLFDVWQKFIKFSIWAPTVLCSLAWQVMGNHLSIECGTGHPQKAIVTIECPFSIRCWTYSMLITTFGRPLSRHFSNWIGIGELWSWCSLHCWSALHSSVNLSMTSEGTHMMGNNIHANPHMLGNSIHKKQFLPDDLCCAASPWHTALMCPRKLIMK